MLPWEENHVEDEDKSTGAEDGDNDGENDVQLSVLLFLEAESCKEWLQTNSECLSQIFLLPKNNKPSFRLSCVFQSTVISEGVSESVYCVFSSNYLSSSGDR